MQSAVEQQGASFALIIQSVLPDGRFVVTNSCRRDIPLGTKFVGLYAEELFLDLNAEGQTVVQRRTQGPEIAVRVEGVEFFRRSIDCVPCGHHAGVSFAGDGVDRIVDFLLAHPCPWFVSLTSEPTACASAPSICEQIAAARGGDLIVRIEQHSVTTPQDAARLFGLFDLPDIYREVSEAEAKSLLVAVLVKDMAHASPLVLPDEALALAETFLSRFSGEVGVRYFTNSDLGKPKSYPNAGLSWHPATEHTFDSGILVIAAHHVGCAWFMHED